jgi:hypothetical protein
MGFLQSLVTSPQIHYCRIDLARVQWADPLALLYLALILAESPLKQSSTTLDLGRSNPRNEAHGIFLKFLAQQGFLTAFSESAIIIFDGEIQNQHRDVSLFRLRMASQAQATHFQNADCIFARIIRVDDLSEHRLQQRVEEFLEEARTRAVTNPFYSDPLSRDMLFQKLRKLLHELLLNVAEHSHLPGQPAYAGVFARVRGAKPQRAEEAGRWSDLFNKCNSIYGQSQFLPNPYADWLELYLCDAGVGLTSRIAEWRAPAGDPDAARSLAAAQAASNPLRSIAPSLFKTPLSRFPRHNSQRTAVTGLQHLGNILSHGGDYCRLYAQFGTWVGGQHPWGSTVTGSQKDVTKDPRYSTLVAVSGTAYVFSIQPSHRTFSQQEDAWVLADSDARARIVGALCHHGNIASTIRVEYYEFCEKQSCAPPLSFPPSESADVMVMRPPRLVSKQDLAKWLLLLAGDRGASPSRRVRTFVIAELTPFQTLTLRELLLHVVVHESSHLDILLVAQNWAVTCLCTSPGEHRLTPNILKAERFFYPTKDSNAFGAKDLAVRLQLADSELFWESPDSPFFRDAPVEWLNDQGQVECVLRRYLDLPLALTDPQRYAASLRAVRRLIELHPDHYFVPGDDLVASLVNEAQLETYTPTTLEEKLSKKIVVGSVGVTLATVQESAEGSESTMHLMIHRDANPDAHPHALVALLWLSQLPNFQDTDLDPCRVAVGSPWRRIPHTPFIAPAGEKSISILRYMRSTADFLDFSRPWYGRTPEDTYNDFDRLRILKLGHWKYGNHHDLITVNLWLAFQLSSLSAEPLFSWLYEQFRDLFCPQGASTTTRAQVLIYPSHRVTDTIVDRIRRDPMFRDSKPVGGMIPVKFLGIHTVSPLLASHMVAHHIESLIEKLSLTSWSGVILDDGAVTGKHLRELTQFLQSLGAREVYTIALIDRTGLPAQDGVMPRFLERHRRFWRWDVPTLGHGRDCPLCQALNIAQTAANKLFSQRQRSRLSEWELIWRARDLEREWHQAGLTSVPFRSGLPITFGIDGDATSGAGKKKIFANNSTAAAALLIELTRLTTRADVAMKKARDVTVDYPAAAIEILVAQTLLFFDELRIGEKRERVDLLLQLLWGVPTTGDITALAGLLFALVDHDVLHYIWERCRSEYLKERLLRNLDAILAINIIRYRHQFISGQHYIPGGLATQTERDNFILLGGGDLRALVRGFLKLYRNPDIQDRISDHTTPLRERFLRILDGGYCDPKSVHAELLALVSNSQLISNIIEGLADEGAISDPIDLTNLQAATDALEKIGCEDCSTQHGESCGDGIRAATEVVYRLLYGGDSLRGIFRVAANQFLRRVHGPTGLSRFIGDIALDVCSRWTELVNNRCREESAQRWLKGDGVHPEISCGVIPPATEFWLYCDTFVTGVIRDLFQNVFHTPHRTHNPWDSSDAQEADLWWRVVVEGDYLVLELINITVDRAISLKQSVCIAGLERTGGTVTVAIVDNKAITRATIPMHSAFFKES